MAAISQMIFSYAFENYFIMIKYFLKFVPKGPIDNNTVMV